MSQPFKNPDEQNCSDTWLSVMLCEKWNFSQNLASVSIFALNFYSVNSTTNRNKTPEFHIRVQFNQWQTKKSLDGSQQVSLILRTFEHSLNIYLHYHNTQDLQFWPKMPFSYLSYKCKNHSRPWSLFTNILKEKTKDIKTRRKKQSAMTVFAFPLLSTFKFSQQSRWILKNNQMALQVCTVRISVLTYWTRHDRQDRAMPAYQSWKICRALDHWTRVISRAMQNKIDRKFEKKAYFFFSSTFSLPPPLSKVLGWEVEDRGTALKEE